MKYLFYLFILKFGPHFFLQNYINFQKMVLYFFFLKHMDVITYFVCLPWRKPWLLQGISENNSSYFVTLYSLWLSPWAPQI